MGKRLALALFCAAAGAKDGLALDLRWTHLDIENAAPASSLGCPGPSGPQPVLAAIIARWAEERHWSHDKACMTYIVGVNVLASGTKTGDLTPFLDLKGTLLFHSHIRVNQYTISLVFQVYTQDIPFPYAVPMNFYPVEEYEIDARTGRGSKKVYFKTGDRLLTIFPWDAGGYKLVYSPPLEYHLMEEKDIEDGLRAALEALKTPPRI